MALGSYQQLNLTGNLTLVWPFSFDTGIFIFDRNDINPNQDGWKLIMPDARIALAGQYFLFNNISGFSFDLTLNDGTTVLASLATGEVIEIYLTNNTTANGVWRVTPYGGGMSAITQVTAESSNNSITITNGIVNPPTGTIDFKLPQSLSNLVGVTTTGFLIVKTTNPLTFRTVELIPGINISIADADGIGGNPTIDVNTVVTGLSSLEVGDMTLTGELITNNITNGNIQLNSNGTGKVQINGVNIDASANITDINNFVQPRAFCVFTDTLTGPTHVITLGNKVNVNTVTGAAGTYTITFLTPMTDANYGVEITIGSNGGVLPFISNGYFIVRTTTEVTIEVTDASGALVLSAPDGVTVMIMST